jgi:hypothetical protein
MDPEERMLLIETFSSYLLPNENACLTCKKIKTTVL